MPQPFRLAHSFATWISREVAVAAVAGFLAPRVVVAVAVGMLKLDSRSAHFASHRQMC